MTATVLREFRTLSYIIYHDRLPVVRSTDRLAVEFVDAIYKIESEPKIRPRSVSLSRRPDLTRGSTVRTAVCLPTWLVNKSM